MGNLNNLYISQSFQSLAHLGTNTSLVPGTMTVLQDGIGQSLNISFDGTNISSSGNIYAANITASVIDTGSFATTSSLSNLSASLTVTDNFLQSQINALDASGSAASVALLNVFTASQLIINSGYNSFTSSTNVRLNNLETTTASLNTFTQSQQTYNTNNDTKWNTLGGQSGSWVTESETGSFATTGSNTFVGNQTISGSLFVSGSEVVAGPVTASRLQINGVTDLNGTLDVSNDATFRGDVLIQSSGEQKLKMRSTSGGGVSQGFDLLIQTSSFIIRDETHGIDFLNFDYISSSADHILKLEANRFELNSGSLGVSGSFTASLQEGFIYVGNASGRTTTVATSSFATTIDTGSFATTASFNSYTSSNDQKVNSLISATGSYATTGSNTFRGNQNNIGAIQAADADYGPQYVSPTVFQGVGSASVAFQQFINAGNYDCVHIQSNLNAGTNFQDLPSDTFVLNTWLNIPTNTGNNPAPQFKRGLAVTGSTNIAELTASLQQGYVWVGDASGRTTTVATSSFGSSVNTGSLMRTGSVSGNVLTFTKGDATTFSLTVATGSTINTGSFAITGSNVFNGAQIVNNFPLQVSNYNEPNLQAVSPTVFQGIGTASVAYEQYINAGNYDAIHIQSNLNAGTDFQDLPSDTFVLNTWLNIPTNTGNNPAPQFKRGLSVTGSTNVQQLTASLQQGHLFVGNASGRTTTVATSSFVSTNQTGSFALLGGSNNFTNTNTFNSVTVFAGGNDNYATTQLVNNQTLLTRNVSVSSGYNSGSFQQLSMSTGSGGNTSFQMQSILSGSTADLSIFNSAGSTSGRLLADTILFAKNQGFPNTPSTTFTVESTNIKLVGDVKVNKGSDKTSDIVTVNGTATISNSLVTSDSIILVTCQDRQNQADEYPPVVGNKGTGTFDIFTNVATNMQVAYLIINPV
jgi:hypothetical protein